MHLPIISILLLYSAISQYSLKTLCLLQKKVNISNVVNITQEVKRLSVDNSSHPLQAGDIDNIATVLKKIVEVKQKANEVGYMTSICYYFFCP